MTRVKVGRFLTIQLMDLNPDGSGRYLGGYIFESNIKKNTRNKLYNSMMNGIEAIVLAHAINGVNVERPAYTRGIRDAIGIAESNVPTKFFRTSKDTLVLYLDVNRLRKK